MAARTHLPLRQFLIRLSRPALFALVLVIASWWLGAIAYHDVLQTEAGKWFASVYALYSGLVFLAVAGLVFAPWAHRLLRRFHVEN
jgi:hypothetical protein